MIAFDKNKAIANHGDITRLSMVYKKLEEGKEVTVCFLGGSITQGSLSSTPETCYAYRTYDWLKNKFADADIKYVNAGIGGTTSAFGAARVEKDVLSYDPDLVVVEFSVNDECTDYFLESYEGLIRKLLYSESAPAVVCLFNFFYENGKTTERLHSKVARHYGLPAASMQGAIYQDILSGKIEDISLLSPDGLHPNDEGHELVSKVLTYLLETLYDEYKNSFLGESVCAGSGNESADAALFPITENTFETAVRLDNRNFEPSLFGFMKDDSDQRDITDCFKNGWLGQKKNDRIVFELKGEYECSGIAIQYDKTMKRPAPVVAAIVDDNRDDAVIIDSAFDETWGDLLEIRQLFLHGEKAEHKLEIELIDDKDGKAVDFNLVSVIITR
jgi:lysophospholipase L1-like esterase